MPATVHEYDEQNRLVRSYPESEWDELEQGWMLALAMWRDLHCDGCGGDLTETTAHEDWVPLPPMRCHKCTAIAIAQEKSDRPQPMALRWGATRRR